MRLRSEDKVTSAELARRVEVLEAEVSALKQQLQAVAPSTREGLGPKDLQGIVRIFAEDPGFDEAVRLGREWRKRMNRRPEWKGKQRRAKPDKE